MRTKDMKPLVYTLATGFLLWAVLLASGCASPGSPPVETIAKADLTLQQARESSAYTKAPLNLDTATEKLAAARTAVEEENYRKADRLAQEALVEARLAKAKAESETIENLVAELEESVKTLREEIDRLQGTQG